MKIENCHVSGPLACSYTQHSILASNGEYTRPLVFLQRPKWITDDAQWETICQSIRISLPFDFEVSE